MCTIASLGAKPAIGTCCANLAPAMEVGDHNRPRGHILVAKLCKSCTSVTDIHIYKNIGLCGTSMMDVHMRQDRIVLHKRANIYIYTYIHIYKCIVTAQHD